MNCRDYERLWNERLDARDVTDGSARTLMDEHAAICPACQALGVKFQALSLALGSLGPIAGPSFGFVDRVLAAEANAPVIAGRLNGRRLAVLAAAAVLMVGVTIAVTRFGSPAAPVVVERAIAPADLSEALADARSATWDLAREASAPAAWVGREVLGSARLPVADAAPELSIPESVPDPAHVWESMGDRVNAGVRPLEGSARHAFGFLLSVSPEADRPLPVPAGGA